MKTKSFECPKFIRNSERNMLAMSEAWSTSCLSHRPREPGYYTVDCQILICILLNACLTPKWLISRDCEGKGVLYRQSVRRFIVSNLFTLEKYNLARLVQNYIDRGTV